MKSQDNALYAISQYVVAIANERKYTVGALDALYDCALAEAFESILDSAFFGGSSAAPALGRVLAAIGRQQASASLVIGECFEQLRGTRISLDRNGELVLESSSERRSKGVYYTPASLAESLAAPSVREAISRVRAPGDLKKVSILDPAVGCGALLLAALRVAVPILSKRRGFRELTEKQIAVMFAKECLYGVDIDPIAIAMTRALIMGEVGDRRWRGRELHKHLKVGDAVAVPLAHWSEWFPEVASAGFSAVVTNPPWSKLRPLRHEFFEHMDAEVRKYQGTRLGQYIEENFSDTEGDSWKKHVSEYITLSASLRASTEYAINDEQAGDADLYKYFTERALTLLAEGGSAGMLLPSGILRAQGAVGLRRIMYTTGTIKRLVEYINKKKIFDIHSMYRFCSVTFVKGETKGISAACFGVTEVKAEYIGTELSLDYLEAVGGRELLIPEVRSDSERDLLLKLRLINRRGRNDKPSWKFSFKRELDMTNDAKAFFDLNEARESGVVEGCADNCEILPVYEGRMVQQYNHSAKKYISGQGRGSVWQVSEANSRLVPHYYIRSSYATMKGWRPQQRAAYCEVSGHANERTILACLVPGNAVCGNKVPTLVLSEGGLDLHLLWIAYANSFVVDWMMRRWVSTTINHFYWRNVELPSVSGSEGEQLMISLARILQKPDGVYDFGDLNTGARSLMRSLIDAVVFETYQVSDSEMELVFEDFPQFVRRSVTDSFPRGAIALVRRAREILRAKAPDPYGVLLEEYGTDDASVGAVYAPAVLTTK